MAEKLPDVVVSEQMLPPSYEDLQSAEAKNIMAEMKSKMEVEKKDIRKMLKQASEVKEDEGESLYRGLFGMLVKDCVDSIVKEEVAYLTAEMCRFRNNIAQKMVEDESRADAPMNIARMPEGFAEVWRIWRAVKGIIKHYWSSFNDKMYMCCSVRRFIVSRASDSLFPNWMRVTLGSLGVKNSPWYPEVVSKTRP